ncbi:hypothetical protein H5410_025787 [Solanum commersonii]|uniref:Uncharacterized protein n=1 Tax=Solanum commersonii TaxID=4109 RepID=A0A9J5YX09_SOLCO|nr:hypothetical protein H5410_025787 [Solanum commersonii]
MSCLLSFDFSSGVQSFRLVGDVGEEGMEESVECVGESVERDDENALGDDGEEVDDGEGVDERSSDDGEGERVGVDESSDDDSGNFLLFIPFSSPLNRSSLNMQLFKRFTSANFTGFNRKSSAPSSRHLLSN